MYTIYILVYTRSYGNKYSIRNFLTTNKSRHALVVTVRRRERRGRACVVSMTLLPHILANLL